MSGKKPKIIFAAGGTGGHLFPALAIADELRKDAEILFVGTRHKIEARVVPAHGYAFKAIWISGFHRSFRPGNLAFPLKTLVSLVQSFFLIRDFKPDVVIGTGGYVSGPVLYAASLLGIATVLHESNSYPGVTTRFLAGRATKVFLGSEHARARLRPSDNVELVGTPVRDSLHRATRADALRFFGLNPKRKTVLIVGGSLGAGSINQAVQRSIKAFAESGLQIIWQTGKDGIEQAREEISGRNTGWVGAFIERMDLAYAVADLVVCRAGATTIAELTSLGKPAVLIPFPAAAADHQTLNARALVDAGAAEMIPDRELESLLKDTVLELSANPGRLRRMASASKKLGKPDAAGEIAVKILSMIKP